MQTFEEFIKELETVEHFCEPYETLDHFLEEDTPESKLFQLFKAMGWPYFKRQP